VIAADTSVWVEFFKGTENPSSRQLELALSDGALVLPLPVLFEILSGPGLTTEAKSLMIELPRLDLLNGYWERAGELRRRLLKNGFKARAMDCLIAQSCIDHRVGLVAADADFRHFVKDGLRLVGLGSQ
jgi:predicted nucleic acid-binding protein